MNLIRHHRDAGGPGGQPPETARRCACAQPATVCACCGAHVHVLPAAPARSGLRFDRPLTSQEAEALIGQAQSLMRVDPAVEAARAAREAEVEAALDRLTRR